MSRSRAAVFTARAGAFFGAAAIVLAIPFLGATTASAGEVDPPTPPSEPTATTNGHDWNDGWVPGPGSIPRPR